MGRSKTLGMHVIDYINSKKTKIDSQIKINLSRPCLLQVKYNKLFGIS